MGTVRMITYARDNGDGSSSIYFVNTFEELLEWFHEKGAPTESIDELQEWCYEDTYERGCISSVDIQIRDDGTIEPFWVCTD